jgi:hypothetical protein
MNFTEVVTEVLTTVKRPDKVTVIRREVNAAVAFFSGNQNFSRDVAELVVPIDDNEFTQAVLFASLPRYRKIKYIKRAGTKNYLKRLTAAELGTPCDMQDKFYVAGAGINISMTTKAANLDIGYYQYPPVLTDAAPTYWMIEGGWPMVFNRAASKVFADIGDDASAKLHEAYARLDYQAFCDDAEKDLGFA